MITSAQIHDLMSNTMLTSVEIIERLGITYGVFYDHVNRTDSEARDAMIAIYGPIGHDGSKDGDRCLRCSVIMLKEYSQTPTGWGEFQRAMGSVCAACFHDLRKLYPQAMKALTTAGCAYCGSKETDVFFLQEGAPGMVAPDPMQAIPLCFNHRRKLNEKSKDELLRDFYDRVDTNRLFTILDWACTSPMPLWDVLCPSCGHRYMPDGRDMLLGPEFWQCGDCDMSDATGIGTHCAQCCPVNLQRDEQT